MDLLHIVETDFMNNRNRNSRLQSFMAFCLVIAVISGFTSISSFQISNIPFTITISIAVIFFMAFIISLAILKQRQAKETRSRAQSQRSFDEIADDHRSRQRIDAFRRQINPKKSRNTKRIITLESFTFTEDSDEYLCMICKLSLRKNQEIIKCPFCHSYFHSEHLQEWLQIADDCPVCNKSLYRKKWRS